MKRLISLLLIVSLMLCFSSCCLKHDYALATCEAPPTCIKCGKTEGEALGHRWKDATCSAPKTCSTCNSTEGEALGHSWNKATCTKAKTCSRCKTTSGQPLEHEPDDYTGLCTMCGDACYSLDNIVVVFTEESTEFCQLMIDLANVLLDFICDRGSKTEYSNVLSNLGDSYTNIVILANYAISHPDFSSSSKKMICLGNVYDEATVSYEVALSLEDYSTFYEYWLAVLGATNDLRDAIEAMSAYI